MEPRRVKILHLLEYEEGLTDREITDKLEGHSAPQQPVNQICRRLAERSILFRRKRQDGLIGNFLSDIDDISQEIVQEQDCIKKEGNGFSRYIEENSFELIKKMGFVKAGSWEIEEGQLSYQLGDYLNVSRVLYAFVVNGVVTYIGKTNQKLSKRMYSYKNPGSSQLTNLRIIDIIKNCLDKGLKIDIYVFISHISIEISDIPINVAAGLEDNLIIFINPEWNILI